MEKIKAHCNGCERETNHEVLYTHHSPSELHEEMEGEANKMIICLGCESVSFLVVHLDSYMEKQEEGRDPVLLTFQYPPAKYRFDSFPMLQDEEQEYLPRMLYELYPEIISAFENDSAVLAGIGLRTLVEAICIQENITGRNLETKIRNLQVSGYISVNELPTLDILRKIGNVSAHKIASIPLEDLSYALDIVNHVLKSIYVLPKHNKKLSRRKELQ